MTPISVHSNFALWLLSLFAFLLHRTGILVVVELMSRHLVVVSSDSSHCHQRMHVSCLVIFIHYLATLGDSSFYYSKWGDGFFQGRDLSY